MDKQTVWYSHASWMSPDRNALVSGEDSSRGRKEVLEKRTQYDGIYAGEMVLLIHMSVVVYCLYWLINSHVEMQDEVLRNFLHLVDRICCFNWPHVNLIFIWPYIIDINNMDNTLGSTIMVY
jgi:hypothetical protein